MGTDSVPNWAGRYLLFLSSIEFFTDQVSKNHQQATGQHMATHGGLNKNRPNVRSLLPCNDPNFIQQIVHT